MRFPTTALRLLLLGASYTLAFKNTAPLLLFSSLPPPADLEHALASASQIQTQSQAFGTTKQILSNTSPDLLILISRPSSAQTLSEIPELKRAFEHESSKTRIQVREVIEVDVKQVDNLVAFTKTEMGQEVHVEEEGVWVFIGKQKAEKDARTLLDTFGLGDWVSKSGDLQKLDLEALSESGIRFTVIFVGTPSISEQEDFNHELENEFHATEHMDLKRDLGARDAPVQESDDRPLFEKYQFFTPGIFMGLVAAVIMISIGSVGLNAVASLQVSYGAFDKENGPAAQKKQQQHQQQQ